MLFKHSANIVAVGLILCALRNCRSASLCKNGVPPKGNPRRRSGSSFPNGSSSWVWIYLNISNEQSSTWAFTADSLFDERVVDFIISFSTHRTFWGLLFTEASLGIARSLI